jgi:tagatose-1,6-bisphosphate aldolase non-catalytic subunit AgaZ/GatZ
MEELPEGLGGTIGHATWTSTQSALMLTHLANVVASGAKTSMGFNKVHLNSSARAIDDKFSIHTGK